MNESSFQIESIALAHKFASPPGWFSSEYSVTRPRDGLVYVLFGSASYEYPDGDSFLAVKDDLLYMPAGVPYLTRCGEEEFLHLTVNFNRSGAISLPRRRNCSESPAVRRDMQKLVEEWSRRQSFYAERCTGMLYLLLCKELDIAKEGSHSPDEKIRTAIRLMGDNYRQEISIPQLAESCGISETYFRRLFTRAYGMSPLDYITHLRITYACELLRNTSLSIETVGYECGYGDPAYFCRVFKKNTGLSPSAYRLASN